MNQVAVLGDRDSVIGYRAIGMTVIELNEASEAVAAIEELIRQQYAVIFLTETVAEKNETYLKTLRERKLPAVIPIPSMEGSTGFGMRQIQESVRRAVGIDLFDREVEENDQNKAGKASD